MSFFNSVLPNSRPVKTGLFLVLWVIGYISFEVKVPAVTIVVILITWNVESKNIMILITNAPEQQKYFKDHGIGFGKNYFQTVVKQWCLKKQSKSVESAGILFISDICWPFYCAAIVQALVACEEVAITLRLSKLDSNIRSFWHLIKQAEEDSKNTIA